MRPASLILVTESLRVKRFSLSTTITRFPNACLANHGHPNESCLSWVGDIRTLLRPTQLLLNCPYLTTNIKQFDMPDLLRQGPTIGSQSDGEQYLVHTAKTRLLP